MLQSKKDRLLRSHRQRHLQKKMEEFRSRQVLHNELEAVIGHYRKCSLVTGEVEQLEHQSYFDCEQFAVKIHQYLFQLLVELELEEAKEFLLRC
jgi:hypothetical protein